MNLPKEGFVLDKTEWFAMDARKKFEEEGRNIEEIREELLRQFPGEETEAAKQKPQGEVGE